MALPTFSQLLKHLLNNQATQGVFLLNLYFCQHAEAFLGPYSKTLQLLQVAQALFQALSV